ncbi:hypothetical protein M2271_004374 [Streptomyces sp. LBL]|uniref:SCO3374 family protein n=1 Tax=Streptomyces sp. LBL TaxID=2940562 RepID=UPI002473ADCE|nr:SCO3374 family protein [Streptomyces sp. LBL]MDH6626557.1 hypothetical protein [Streptomyces sp. LBL]
MVPLPRRPLHPSEEIRRGEEIRRWYENDLGWPTVPAPPGPAGSPRTPAFPVRLRVGLRFDVLDVPAEAGRAALRHLAAGSPVALQGGRMRFLVAAGSAEELQGVLDWLEWGSLPLDLTMIGEGGTMDAPLPPETGPVTPREVKATGSASTGAKGSGPTGTRDSGPTGTLGSTGLAGARVLPVGRFEAAQEAAVWVRPPEPGGEADASLPALSALGGGGGGGGGGGAPDLVRVLETVATQCHRLRLRRACALPSAVPRARH